MTTLQVNSAIEREAVLLQQINTPLPAQALADYQELSQKLRDERITPDEHAHLLTLVDVVELADAERMQHLFELAKLRNVPLDALMQKVIMLMPEKTETAQAPSQIALNERLLTIAKRCAALPLLDRRPPDEILGYEKQLD